MKKKFKQISIDKETFEMLNGGKIRWVGKADFSIFQQSFSTTSTEVLTKNSTFECY